MLGETLRFLRDPVSFAEARHARFGPAFRTQLFGSPTVFLAGADANRWIFAGEYRYLQNRWPPTVRRLLGAASLSMLEGEAHRARRRLHAPRFGRAEVEALAPMIDAVGRDHLGRWATAGQISLVRRFKTLAFEVATRFLVGAMTPEERYVLSEDFDTWVAGLFAPLPVAVPGTPFARAVRAGERMTERLTALVRERAQGGARGDDLLSAMLAARDGGEGLGERALVEELQLLLFAGHDTTVTSAVNVMIHLALHPEALARARAEQDTMGDGPIDAERAAASTWLTQVIHESMRLIPPIGGAFRITTEDTAWHGYRIPKGWTVMLAPRTTHYDAAAFSSPRRFDPARFGADRAEHRRTPLAYVPFGGGPRLCLGQHVAMLEMQILLARAVRDLEWELIAPEPTWTALPFPRPSDGGRVRIRPRHASARRRVRA